MQRKVDQVKSKSDLRKQLHSARRQHVASLDPASSALLFRIPPAPLLELIPNEAIVALYHAVGDEAPTTAYAQFFIEHGHAIALPRFKSASEPMHFAQWSNPYAKDGLALGAFGLMEPDDDSPELTPDVLIVPLLGFTERGERIGQGGGHYDRWLSDHPETCTIGMAWDVQLCEELPVEPHDVSLNAIVTPTRMYGPF